MHASHRFDRGTFITGLSAAALAPSRALAQTAPLPLVRPDRPLAPVKVAAARVIRTVVGLRPFRPSGFVLRAQSFAGKTLVHNYGHGGGGVSLSWGCATLAADLVAGHAPRNAAVIGCGAIGLSTARILQDRGWNVTIYAASLPPNTTSNIAGALWSPVSVYDHSALTPAFHDVFLRATRLANRAFQLMTGPLYGIRWIENYTMKNDPKNQDAIDYAGDLGITDQYADVVTIDPAATPFTYSSVRRFTTMLIEPNTFLPAVMRDFFLRGGKIVVRSFASMRQWRDLPEPVVFNCTGLGAGKLVGDDSLTPIRGQITVLEPQPEVDYTTLPLPIYMFPRSDGIYLGGTYDRGNWSLEPDFTTQNRILSEQASVYR